MGPEGLSKEASEERLDRDSVEGDLESRELDNDKVQELGEAALQGWNLEQEQPIFSNEDEVNAESAPDDWYTIGGLKSKLGLDFSVIKRNLDKYPELQSREYRDKSGRINIHYKLDEVEGIPEIAKLLETDLAPDDWYTIGGLESKLGLGYGIIKRNLDKYPELQSREYRDKLGRINIHYKLDEVEGIPEIAKLLETDLAPDDWYTIGGLESKLGLGFSVIKRNLDKYPELQSREYRDKSGRINIHYKLDEVEGIPEIAKFLETDLAPDDWYTIGGLKSKLGLGYGKIKNNLDKHPELQSRKYRDKSGQIHDHYKMTKDLNDIILEDSEKMDAGTSLAEKTVAFYVTQAVCQNRVERNCRPEWLRHPVTKYKREIDIFIAPPPEPGVGIEYDGAFYHQDADRDMEKNRLAKDNKGISIVHIREKGCPELTDGSICINRNNNSEESLEESIRSCLLILQERFLGSNMQMPEVNISRDMMEINKTITDEMKKAMDEKDAFEELSLAS